MTETRKPYQQDIEKDIPKYADQLRAGLLDDDPAFKARVQAALAVTPSASEFWDTVREELGRQTAVEDAISHRLRVRRREALHRANRSRFRRPLWPQWATATACAIALVAGTVWTVSDYPATPAAQQVAIDNVPELHELTENLDFYAWLDTQHASASTQSPR